MSSITIDTSGSCIFLNCGVGETDVTFQVSDIYETWKDWVLLSDNSKYLQGMDSAGGEPLGGSEALGRAYFLLTSNGWKICPNTVELNVKIILQGNLFASPATDSLFDYAGVVSGGHTHIEMRTSTLPSIMETGVSGLTPSESTQLSVIDQVKTLNDQILALNQQMSKLIALIPAAL